MSVQQIKFKEIADKIREKLGTTDLIKPSDFASKIDEVYQAGRAGASGGDDSYTLGRQAEWSDFWDAVQTNGTRTSYNCAFSSVTWTQGNFKPKYDLNINTAERIFYQFNLNQTPFDLVEHLNSLPNSQKESGYGIDMNFSNCTRFYYAFNGAAISRLGIIDMSKSTGSNANSNAFGSSKIATIDKFIFSENTDTNGLFTNATLLANINEIEGTIGKTISFSNCPLSKTSIENVINALSDTTSGLTCTFQTAAKEAAFTTEEWAALIATKPNWSFTPAV